MMKEPSSDELDDLSLHTLSLIRSKKSPPKNEYEHAHALIDSVLDVNDEENPRYSQITDEHIQLSNIESNLILYQEQITAQLLTHMLSMGRRNEGLMTVFVVLNQGRRNAILMTKTMKNTERKLQATVGTHYQPKEYLTGYGGMPPQQIGQQDQGGGNIFSRIFGGKKKNIEP